MSIANGFYFFLLHLFIGVYFVAAVIRKIRKKNVLQNFNQEFQQKLHLSTDCYSYVSSNYGEEKVNNGQL
jgi:hypothetical protein